MVGLRVELSDSTPIGIVKAVHNFGASDLLELARPGLDTVMLPFTSETVPEVDIKGGKIVAAPPEGLLAEEPKNV